MPTGPGTSSGVKRRQTKAESKTSGEKKAKSKTAGRSEPDCSKKICRIPWNLAKTYAPWLKIILKPFKNKYRNAVLIIIGLIFLDRVVWEFWSLNIPFLNAATVVWKRIFPADLTGVYFNDAPYHFTKCDREDKRRQEAEELLDKGGNTIFFIRGNRASGRTKSGSANSLGVCLSESLKQIKKDNQPVDVITINASSDSSRVMKSIYDAILAPCGLSQKADCIKKFKEEFDFSRDLFPSESNISITDRVLKFLCRKLDEVFNRRKSFAVVIVYIWGNSDPPALSCFLELSSKYFTMERSISEW